MKKIAAIIGLFWGLAACSVSAPNAPVVPDGPKQDVALSEPAPIIGRAEVRTRIRGFISVLEDVTPIARDMCLQTAPDRKCDFVIVVDDTVNAPANAFQTLDEAGNPVIAFTIPLIMSTRNRDELAFIMAHEAAHHILDHIAQQRRNAQIGAGLGGLIGALVGPDAERTAQQVGATIGARRYSKDFELEADILGAQITQLAGYDPLRGAAYFERIPDPGDQFLGTHPANAERLQAVRQTVAAGL